MKEELLKLKSLRTKKDNLKQVLDSRLKQFNEANADLIVDIEESGNQMFELELSIREQAIKEYEETNNKKLDFGVGIRIMNKLVYDSSLALEWAKRHNLALCLDKKVFESVAKSQTLLFVEKKEVVTATIPKEIKVAE